MGMRTGLAGVVLATTMSTGCGLADAGPPVASEMHERFGLLTQARDHVIRGDLAAAKAAGAELAAVEAPRRLPRAWRTWIKQMDAQATSIAEAPDLLNAALMVGQAGATCGGCHTDNRGGPSLEGADGIPAQAWQPGMNMPLHKWAVDWMWLGLVAQDTDAWRRGAEELDSQPLTYRFEGAAPPGHKPQLEQLVYVVAEKALDAPVTERGALMGQLLATCAECHVQNRPAPAPADPPSTEPEPAEGAE